MQDKGKDIGAWNWQAYDRQEGFIPNDEDKVVKDEHFNLEKEILKIDEDLQMEGSNSDQRMN